MAAQHKVPGLGYINDPGTGNEYALPDGGFFIESSGVQSFSYTGAGGLVFAGTVTATLTRITSRTAAGGLTFAGTSAVARVIKKVVSGGIVFGGAAATAFHESTRTVVAAGGIVFGGAATVFRVTVGRVFNYIIFARRVGRR